MNSTLMPYQEEAVKWCASRENDCCILAYDMGLGKTVVACGLLVRKPEKTIIMVPSCLIDQWKSEIHKHTSGINVAIYHGSNRKYKTVRDAISEADVILTTTAVVANDIKNLCCIPAKRWIIDEAHKLRNKNSIIYKALHTYAPMVQDKVFLTGTPLCNSSNDIISLLCLSNIPHYNEEEMWKNTENATRLSMLRKIIPSILLRKTKDETILDVLPGISEETHYLKITDSDQKYAYNSFINDDEILRRILRMRQSLNSHTQLMGELNNSSQPQIPVKIQKVLEILHKIPSDEKIIIFSHFTQLLHQIYDILSAASYDVLLYHGSLNRATRTKIITDFKTRTESRVLLINLRAGGVGLNLVEANNVILMEPYWNDAEQLQAINRVYRIGQKRAVKVHKLVIKNSIEAWLQTLQKSKSNISKFLIDKNEIDANELISQRKIVKELFKVLKNVSIPETIEEEKIIEDNIDPYML
jgi:SNF2 family DNA or RNA helicase